MINGYRDLQVWRKSMDLAAECYRLSAGFPRSEAFGITLQLRKSAVSVPANIAEGRGRRSTREFIRFLDISYGSLTELETHVMLAERLELCGQEEAENLLTRSNEIGRMLNGLRESLNRRQLKAASRSSKRSLNPES